MHILNIVGVIVSLLALCNGTGEPLACDSSLTTVFLTVSATATVTETIDLNSQPGVVGSTAAGISGQPTTTQVTTLTEAITQTVVVPETRTSYISISEAMSSTSTVLGLYYFSVDNGTTIWLGGATPPAAQSYVIKTSTIVIEPVPSSSSISADGYFQTTAASTTTSTATIDITSFLTITSTEVLTETLTEPVSSPSVATVSGFSGFGANGWNATTLVQHVKSTGTGVWGWKPVPSVFATADSSVSAQFPKLYHGSAPHPSAYYSKRQHNARQVGAIVTATIDGVVVSWTNNWYGFAPPVSPIPASFSPIPQVVTISAYPTVYSVSVETVTVTPPAYTYTDWGASSTSSAIIPGYPFSTGFSSSSISTSTSTSSWWPIISAGSSGFISPTPPAPTVNSVAPFQNSTSTSALPSSPTGCGASISYENIANFTIDFDDLPRFGGSPGDDNYPPIFNPYHNLYWAQGFAYCPPPEDPYAPISDPQLAVFVTNQTANIHPANITTAPGPGDDVDGQFGAGPNYANSAFWIDAFSVYLGCTNAGPGNCTLTINGYGYEPDFNNTVLVARTTAYQPPCATETGCDLFLVELGQEFVNLTALQVVATIGNSALLDTWYMDNLEIGWSDTSCLAQVERQSTVMKSRL